MSAALAAFQAGFAAALFDPADPRARTTEPAFAVYRNTVMKGCIDALEANHPAVASLIGAHNFRVAASAYVTADPPRSGSLLHYGEGFAAFLAGFEPARAVPHLSEVARLDRFWIEAHVAADATPATGDWLLSLTPDELGRTRVAPHPSARWRWFAQAPVYTVWRHHREGQAWPADRPWVGEGALLVRPLDAVTWHPLGQADCAFLDACAAGHPLLVAASAAQAVHAAVDMADLLARLLRAGALVPRSTDEEGLS